ncbi:hypothetical protein [Actinocorallia sp. A-T 12471]|uniref:hypothetical protein n=1 Tax=Actinocorallia sp. A-T 12471 TaxID=3089813 RepID=UPI0029CF5C8C|nr:hypothetical protein [Actinocorallia sp. A-T 12471]MDX6739367.1 hypothetical protein [Actinocorallia sp. A-T 12471]
MSEEDRRRWGTALNGQGVANHVNMRMSDGSVVSVSADGCVSEARRTLYGSLEDAMTSTALAGNLPIEAKQRAAADPAMKALNATWSACMKDKGHPNLPRPEDARVLAAEAPRDEALTIAVADAECEDRSGYAPKRTTLEDRYFTAALTFYEPEVAALTETHRKALARAKKLLSTPTP